MHTLTFKFILAALVASITLTGCVSTTTYLDDHFGEAVNAAKAKQTINPDASQNTDPVAGIDGQAAKSALDNYHDSFETPPVNTNIFNIGVGTGGSSGTP